MSVRSVKHQIFSLWRVSSVIGPIIFWGGKILGWKNILGWKKTKFQLCVQILGWKNMIDSIRQNSRGKYSGVEKSRGEFPPQNIFPPQNRGDNTA